MLERWAGKPGTLEEWNAGILGKTNKIGRKNTEELNKKKCCFCFLFLS
jgi:hypothetical protein